MLGKRNTEKLWYKIGDVAEILNIPISTLRFWEKNFTVIKPRRSSGGTRYYSRSDIEKIRLVYYMVKDQGLKLSAAEEHIKRNTRNISKRHEAIERLKEIKTGLQKLLDALNTAK